jgi:carbamate kinase
LKKFHKYYEDRTRGTAIITNPDNMERALAGETGTRITPG